MISRRRLFEVVGWGRARRACDLGKFMAQDARPSKDIHSICMFPPGSGADILVRFYARNCRKLSAGQ